MKNIIAKERQSIPTMHFNDDEQSILHIEGSYSEGMYPYELLVVLVQGGRGDDYAAYYGLVPTKRHDPEIEQWVARHGHKLTFERAKLYFPIGLDKECYRA